eukprot:TRINITY_DN1385_c0_g1_i3.p1 TRINITY_DN1385_c0_g1~~TRINITY_DN1385_c0_g1_i3.p1  ORF type:complete len:209 (+),score=30.61 TRINITY_DN1385_c0_g1_i3:39-665(+)
MKRSTHEMEQSPPATLILSGTTRHELHERPPDFHTQTQFLLATKLATNVEPQETIPCPKGIDPLCWQYEHMRQAVAQLSVLLAHLADKCNSLTCPQMKADQWVFYCASHHTPKDCCAMDYAFHTLDNAAEILCNRKNFPDREKISESSTEQLQSIARRVYRIFAHAYFHHNEVYNTFENETRLCARFVGLCRAYDLMPATLYIIPQQL